VSLHDLLQVVETTKDDEKRHQSSKGGFVLVSETFDYENEDDDEDEGKTRWFVPPLSTTGVGL
jgi:hypothetical protein